jgi:hypothetical protein
MAEHCVENAPLNLRAWVSQERQLSRRILHFGRTQLFWECYECMACERYPSGLPQWALPSWFNDPTILKKELMKHAERHKTTAEPDSPPLRPGTRLDIRLYWAWCSFRVHYSTCALSRDSDKLVAMGGISQQIGEVTGDKIVAGLWQSRIVEELCWLKDRGDLRNTPVVEPVVWRAPTWSWASSNAKIWASTLTKMHHDHATRCFDAQLVDLDVKSKASGELEHA